MWNEFCGEGVRIASDILWFYVVIQWKFYDFKLNFAACFLRKNYFDAVLIDLVAQKVQLKSVARKGERYLISSKWNMNKRQCISSYTYRMTLLWLKFIDDLVIRENYNNIDNNNDGRPFLSSMIGSVNLWHTLEFNGFTVEWWYWVISFFASVFSNITSNKHSTLHIHLANA